MRTDQQGVSGSGQLATLRLPTVGDSLLGYVYVNSVKAIADGSELSLFARPLAIGTSAALVPLFIYNPSFKR